jgi:hypothetical protein
MFVIEVVLATRSRPQKPPAHGRLFLDGPPSMDRSKAVVSASKRLDGPQTKIMLHCGIATLI